MKKIEILSPAGDIDALKAAISSGADAVYLGLDIFNARIRAKNFTLDTVDEAISLCHAHGVLIYVTLNIQIYNRELSTLMEYVGALYEKGVDALIVADFGVASLIKKYYPDFEIHASTQATVHNKDGAELLCDALGFSRVVLARELDRESIEYISKSEKYETEIFVHGAHCMSVSGQCLLSYCLGGRSGNRGECAQPCRLPYRIGKAKGYPLSLKDMSLSSHIREITKSGVASLKIEGRMKNAQYVGGTVKIWRDLIDSNQNASQRDISTLSALFSRGGFTDGYYTGKIGSHMLGIRSEEDKEETGKLQREEIALERVKIKLYASFELGKRAKLTLTLRGKEYTVFGDVVERAISAPMTVKDIEKNLLKFGSTPFTVEEAVIEADSGIIIRNSQINALRRAGVCEILSSHKKKKEIDFKIETSTIPHTKIKTALFNSEEQIPDNFDYFHIRAVPIEGYNGDRRVNCVMLPPVILDREWNEIIPMLKRAKNEGVDYALATNIGQIRVLKEWGFRIIGDFRFNVFNSPCLNFLRELGMEHIIVSPELTLAQLRDFYGCGVIVYGKIPMLTTHKCFLKDSYGCDKCRGYISDRQNTSFFAQGIFGHRNVMYNSVPIYMADKDADINSYSHHFIFTDEEKQECYEIIEAYKLKKETVKGKRRIK